MNPTPTDPAAPPRFSCRVARTLLSTLGRTDGPAPRGLGSGHVAHCADCQQFFSACDALDLALTRDAARLEKTAPSGLEHRISLAVARSIHAEPSPAEARRPAPARPAFPMFALLGVAAGVAIAIFLYQRPAKPAAASASTNIVAAIDFSRDFLAAHPLSDKVRATLDTAASDLPADPLTAEAEALRADARSALRFLALNFLPSEPESEAPTPRRRSG